MKTQGNIPFFVGILIVGILSMASLTPNAKAHSVTYNDDVWTYLIVSGPDLTKPGDTESYTVSGRLSVTAYGSVHIKFWLDTSSEPNKVILEEDALSYGTYSAGYTFTKTYQVFIPADAINNKYIYAKLDTTSRHFSNFGISLIQNPTYTELQSQVTLLQSQVNSLQSEKTSLQSQVDSLQSQVNDLQTNKTNLQSQVDSLQSESSTTRNLVLLFGVLTAVFIVTTIYFAIRKPKVKPEAKTT